jgi:hypothetical protein
VSKMITSPWELNVLRSLSSVILGGKFFTINRDILIYLIDKTCTEITLKKFSRAQTLWIAIKTKTNHHRRLLKLRKNRGAFTRSIQKFYISVIFKHCSSLPWTFEKMDLNVKIAIGCVLAVNLMEWKKVRLQCNANLDV